MAALAAASGLGACASAPEGGSSQYRQANLRPYVVDGRRYTPEPYSRYEANGLASWYSYPLHTRRTATGEWFDPGGLTAAHKTLPIPCVVEVTNLENGRTVRVRVNDRGPFAEGRIIDVSKAAADRLGFTREGTVRVRVKLIGPAPQADSGVIALAEAAGPATEAAQLF